MPKTVEEIKAAGYRYHHTAYKRGYISRKGGDIISAYDGKYGKGYIVESPNWNSTNFHFISYYVKEN